MLAKRPDRPLRVLFAGGGTGGHICPALAVCEALRARDPATETLFLSTGRPVERRLLEGAGERFIAVMPRRTAALSFKSAPGLVLGGLRGMARALRETRRFSPDVVLGLGGYGQVPGVLAARLLGIPFALFEPNRVLGRAHRLVARAAREVYIQWPGTGGDLPSPERALLTGAPIREEARPRLDKARARVGLRLPADRPVLLIVGGSQGAQALNRWAERVFQLVRRPKLSVVHLTGSRAAAKSLRKVYRRAGIPNAVLSFFTDMGRLYAAADLVLCRSGAGTLSEVAAAGLPSFSVPYPHARDDHQQANAEALGSGTRIVRQLELGLSTYDEIAAFVDDPKSLAEMGRAARSRGFPEAAWDVADRLASLAGARAVPPRPDESPSGHFKRDAVLMP